MHSQGVEVSQVPSPMSGVEALHVISEACKLCKTQKNGVFFLEHQQAEKQVKQK